MDVDVEEELYETGNGGDLDDDGDDARYFGDTKREVILERLCVLLGDDGTEKADEGEMKYVLLHIGDTMDPYDVKFLKEPHDWVDPAPNTAKEEPTFDKVDRPGGWSSFSFFPVFFAPRA